MVNRYCFLRKWKLKMELESLDGSWWNLQDVEKYVFSIIYVIFVAKNLQPKSRRSQVCIILITTWPSYKQIPSSFVRTYILPKQSRINLLKIFMTSKEGRDDESHLFPSTFYSPPYSRPKDRHSSLSSYKKFKNVLMNKLWTIFSELCCTVFCFEWLCVVVFRNCDVVN